MLCEDMKTPEQRIKEKKRQPYLKILFIIIGTLLTALMVWWGYYSFKSGDEESIIYIIIAAIIAVFYTIGALVKFIKNRKDKDSEK